MPASNVSHLSVVSHRKSGEAANMAKKFANRIIAQRIEQGILDRNDKLGYTREWNSVYSQEYYKFYAFLSEQESTRPERVIYFPTANPSGTKYFCVHALAGFNKTSLFVHKRANEIVVGRINFPLDHKISLETKEAILSAWPGPLDRPEENIKRKTTDYIETLYQHDQQRLIRYHNSTNDEQRKVILRLLTELLHRNGSINAPGVTRLLLRPDQTEIQKDESDKKYYETLQKYLLLGKRNEAIKYAKTKKLWDHAQCLAFLDKYQPPMSYNKEGSKLKEDPIVQLNDEYIDSLDQTEILKTVYRSLLNRILQTESESSNVIKLKNVANDTYEFAILSANDCDMEFDQSNEVFKLIQAVKRANQLPNLADGHLISLGFTTMDNSDPSEDLSYFSHLSFRHTDNHASRTLILSNIDMLIINEIWEYCLNLARGTADFENYQYIVELIPYKLIFTSKLLDYGLNGMFSYYLQSIKKALYQVKSNQWTLARDNYYDWDSIERSVEYMSDMWKFVQGSFDPQFISYEVNPLYDIVAQTNVGSRVSRWTDQTRHHSLHTESHIGPPAPAQYSQSNSFYQPTSQSSNVLSQLPYRPSQQSQVQPMPPPPQQDKAQQQSDQLDSFVQQDYRSLPSQVEQNSIPYQHIPHNTFRAHPHTIPHAFANQQATIPEEVNDFNPDPEPAPEMQDDYGASGYGQTSVPPAAPAPLVDRNSLGGGRQMSSSSPVNRSRSTQEPQMDSFNAFSPINQYDDSSRRDSGATEIHSQQPRGPPLQFAKNPVSPPSYSSQSNSAASRPLADSSNVQQAQNGQAQSDSTSRTDGQQQASGDPQRPGFIANLARSLLPKSNSKQMILPDDSSKAIVYDEGRGTWIDTTKGQDEQVEDYNQPPPMVPPTGQQPPTYAMPKSTKSRYPRA